MERFSNTKKLTKANLADVPGNQPGVYRIIDAKGKILYIGKAKGGRLDDRIEEHRGSFERGTQFQYRTTKSKEAAERLEGEEIKKHIPPRNKRK